MFTLATDTKVFAFQQVKKKSYYQSKKIICVLPSDENCSKCTGTNFIATLYSKRHNV